MSGLAIKHSRGLGIALAARGMLRLKFSPDAFWERNYFDVGNKYLHRLGFLKELCEF